MPATIYRCNGCSVFGEGCEGPAPCFLVIHNGEAPTRCVCGDVEPSWALVARVGAEGGYEDGDGE